MPDAIEERSGQLTRTGPRAVYIEGQPVNMFRLVPFPRTGYLNMSLVARI
jgi:hypothetical protein